MSVYLDIKYAARILAKKPAFTVLSVLIVAVGLGLSLYTYSLLSSLVFKPLVLNGDNPIISIEAQFDYSNSQRTGIDPVDMLRVSNEIDLFDGFGVYLESGTTLISDLAKDAAAQKFNASRTQWNIFEFAGVQPIMGRGLQPQDHFEDAEPVIVLGFGTWHNAFSANKNIVGTMVRVEAVPTRVIGVMPQGFAFPAMAETWLPIALRRLAPIERQSIYDGNFAYARLKEGVSFEQFNKALAALNQDIVQSLPDDASYRANSSGAYITAYPFKQIHAIGHYPVFISMFVVVFLILLLTCINVANLLLARVNDRYKEIAIRIALGVPAKRLVLQMLWESVFICCVGGFLAFLLAAWGLELSNEVFDQMFAVNHKRPFWWQVALDAQAVAVLVIAVLAMIAVTGFLPAWRALSGDFNAVLRDGTRGAMGKKAAAANKTLVITEIFLSCAVLVIATILLSASYSAGQADYGVETQNRLTAKLALPRQSYVLQRGGEHEAGQQKKR
ncbi:MAG: ABC transporter permease, partial [Algicola sp.]|nr:ABC transporter permease [Algicola sp.]